MMQTPEPDRNPFTHDQVNLMMELQNLESRQTKKMPSKKRLKAKKKCVDNRTIYKSARQTKKSIVKENTRRITKHEEKVRYRCKNYNSTIANGRDRKRKNMEQSKSTERAKEKKEGNIGTMQTSKEKKGNQYGNKSSKKKILNTRKASKKAEPLPSGHRVSMIVQNGENLPLLPQQIEFRKIYSHNTTAIRIHR